MPSFIASSGCKLSARHVARCLLLVVLMLGVCTVNKPAWAQAAALTGSGAMPTSVTIAGQNNLCNQQFAAAFDAARQRATTIELARDNAFFKYQIAGAFAANCVGKLIGYAQQLSAGVGTVIGAATTANGDPAIAAVTLIATQILNAVFRQLVSNLENQICSITTQLTTAMDSVYQNAICIPSGALNISSQFSFSLNLNLPELSCDGIAINPLQYTQLDPATGQPYGLGEGALTAGALAASGTGGYASGVDGTGDILDPITNAEDDSALIYGEPANPIDDPDYEAGIATSPGAVNGNACLDIQAAVNYLMSNVLPSSSHRCAAYVRRALEAGGLNTAGHPVDAKDYGSFLLSRGYYAVSTSSNLNGYVPQAGDIIVEQPYPGGSSAGHIQMYSGSSWASDYVAGASGMYGGSGYAAHPNYIIYRPGTKTSAGGQGCS